eukprot:scaffold93745_cov39-Phaeocystis_antarctica.AAC.1
MTSVCMRRLDICTYAVDHLLALPYSRADSLLTCRSRRWPSARASNSSTCGSHCCCSPSIASTHSPPAWVSTRSHNHPSPDPDPQ